MHHRHWFQTKPLRCGGSADFQSSLQGFPSKHCKKSFFTVWPLSRAQINQTNKHNNRLLYHLSIVFNPWTRNNLRPGSGKTSETSSAAEFPPIRCFTAAAFSSWLKVRDCICILNPDWFLYVTTQQSLIAQTNSAWCVSSSGIVNKSQWSWTSQQNPEHKLENRIWPIKSLTLAGKSNDNLNNREKSPGHEIITLTPQRGQTPASDRPESVNYSWTTQAHYWSSSGCNMNSTIILMHTILLFL